MKIYFTTTLILLIALNLVFSVSCNKNDYDPNVTVTLALTQNPKSLDPRFTTDATGQRLNQLLYSSLVKVGDNMTIAGDAAKAWEYKNRTYTFKLHPGLTFSNDRPLKEEDIIFSFEEYKKDNCPFKSAFEIIENVSVDFKNDEPTVEIKLKKYSANFLLDLTLIRLLPKEETLQLGESYSDKLIGTGAFTLKSKTLNEIVLESRTNHPIYQPKIKYALFKIILDDATRFLNTYKGSFDIIQSGLPLNKISYIKDKEKYNIYSYPGPSMNYILLNLKKDNLKNKKFRWAISEAINRDALIRYKLEGFAESATSLLPTNNIFHNKDLKSVDFKPDESKKIIKELKLDNSSLVIKTSNNPEVIEVAKVLVSQLENVGLKVNLQSFEWGTFYSDIRNGNYELAIMRWVGLSDPDIYRTAFHSRELPPGRNRGYYVNSKLDKLLDEGIEIESLDKRIAHYKQIQKIVYDEHIIIPLWYNTLVDIVHKRIQNYNPPANGDLSPLYSIEITPQ